ncbi:hypothetical protein [Pedobacter nototheniae]|uniref:hypothetical protein n=1 Tax=Pedobacter nototheniae TaxID=2488994 RepID=UPI00292D280B|nr:hypothetical protein [Pedobacter nototheniae]
MTRYFIICTIILASFIAYAQTLPTAKGKTPKLPYTKMALTAKLLGTAIADTVWYNWCVSPIIGKDKKVHIFGSRWPAKEGMGTILDYWGTPDDHKKLLAVPGRFAYHDTGKLERPAVLMQNGVPTYLYAPATLNINNGKVAESYVFKIDFNNGK